MLIMIICVYPLFYMSSAVMSSVYKIVFNQIIGFVSDGYLYLPIISKVIKKVTVSIHLKRKIIMKDSYRG